MAELTELQKLVSKTWNAYPDDVFIEMVELLDDPTFWEQINLEVLSDEECIDILNRLLSMFREWNYA